jgi:hypothetical protein
MNCPRCGFAQPIDRFCAKCGILIDCYVATPSSLWSRLKTSFAFYAALLLIILISFYLLSTMKKESLAVEPIQTLPAPEQVNRATPAPTSNNRQANTRGALTLVSDQQISTSTTTLSEASIATVVAPAASSEPTSVRVEFALLNREAIEKFSVEAEGQLEVGKYSVSLIPHFHTHYDQALKLSGFQSLASESRTLVIGQPSVVFRGGKEPKLGDTIGFFIEVTPLKKSERGFEYKISIKRTLPDEQAITEPKINTQRFDETLTLPANSAVALSGTLPRKELVAGEDELYKNNILKVMLDTGFKNGEAEFVLFIYPTFGSD